MQKISLVLPIYNEVAILQQVLTKYITDLKNTKLDFEIIAVNDGCTDGSEDILRELARLNRNLKVITLKGRFGKQATITAGMDAADKKSDVVMLADIDIANPVGILGQTAARVLNGEKICHARRENNGFNRIKALYSDIWTSLGTKLYGLDGKYTGKANIAAYSRDVADVINAIPANNKYLRTMRPWTGWTVDYLTYASGYNQKEQENVEAAAKESAEKSPMIKGHKSLKRDKVREHTASVDYMWGLVAGTLLMFVFAIVFSTAVKVPSWIFLIVWLVFIMMLFLTFIMNLRAVLIKRIGVINRASDVQIYEVESVIN
ncbi:MAG: glycosyltransferase [Christensenellaceae bacterium]|jgi:glycosyltransferase involved in cell wall biosynthesis|nr:glycosyltransferase [Christensenellaceae bacterium]